MCAVRQNREVGILMSFLGSKYILYSKAMLALTELDAYINTFVSYLSFNLCKPVITRKINCSQTFYMVEDFLALQFQKRESQYWSHVSRAMVRRFDVKKIHE